MAREFIYYEDLIPHSSYGNDEILLNKDTDLFNKTYEEGYTIIDIDAQDKLKQLLIDEIYTITGKQIKLDDYHREITNEQHTQILNSMPYKKNKLPEFASYLEKVVSDTLQYKVKIFNDDLWVRICRPSSYYKSDFNPYHRDIYLDFYRNTANIYLPISGSDEKSSLTIQPGSHKWNENMTRITRGGSVVHNKKYSVDAIVASKIELHMIRPNPAYNQLLLFSPYLIHGGARNDNDITRFSLEVRFIKEESIEQELLFVDFLKFRNWR